MDEIAFYEILYFEGFFCPCSATRGIKKNLKAQFKNTEEKKRLKKAKSFVFSNYAFKKKPKTT
jgi:hypothetical protein